MSGNKKEEALIHVQGLGKSFGAVDVLKDISVDINKGDVVFVIGPSGSGKSTFLNQVLANALSLGFNSFLYSGELTYQMMIEWFCRTVANPEHLGSYTNSFGKYTKVTQEGIDLN